VLLGEPVAASFSALDPPEHRLRRRILAPAYTREAAAGDEEYARTLARSLLASLLTDGEGEFDVYRDFARRVTARTAGRKAGVPEADAERIRLRLDDMFRREPGQKGTSSANIEAALEVLGELLELIATARARPDDARGDLAALLAGSIDGRPLNDEELVGDLMTILVTGSDTVEFAVAATLYHLQANPEQLGVVRGDRSRLPFAFAEAVRYDHPTDLLCRQVLHDTEVGGRPLRAGQGVLLLWGSANRDEAEFPDADRFDIHRRSERSLLFGHGQHKCIGEHMSMRVGTAILDEFFAAVDRKSVV
jgi:cytochrome P450